MAETGVTRGLQGVGPRSKMGFLRFRQPRKLALNERLAQTCFSLVALSPAGETHRRIKYACATCQEHVAIANKPPQPIEKGLPAPGLCAYTVLSKFGDHQPLYRQEDIHSRLGYTIKNLQGERDFEAVAAGRQQYSVPILQEFKAWLDRETVHPGILPKSPIRAAFTYTLNQWDALCRYTEQGYLSFDNNAAERLVKLPAIGRRNYLFVGSPRGGRGAAVMYSLVSSAKANGVEPFAWLRELFTRLPYHRNSEAFQQAANQEPVSSTELDYLLPDKWLQQNPTHRWTIDHIRRAERTYKPSRPKRRA